MVVGDLRDALGEVIWIVGAALDGDDDVQTTGFYEQRCVRDVLVVGRPVEKLKPCLVRVLKCCALQTVEGAWPVGDVVCARAHLAELPREDVDQAAAIAGGEFRKGVVRKVEELLRGVDQWMRRNDQEGLTLKRLALVPMMKPA